MSEGAKAAIGVAVVASYLLVAWCVVAAVMFYQCRKISKLKDQACKYYS